MKRQPRLLVYTALALAAFVLIPFRVSDYWLSVLNLAAIAAVGALGLNLLTGYTGQISLGQAVFLGVGAYACAVVGGSLALPLPVWLAAAAAAGAGLGLATGLLALRFRGHYVAIVTLALVFLAQHVFRSWTGVSGGNAGRGDLPSPVPSGSLTDDQVWFWLSWATVAAVLVLVANLVKGRPGRAMVAVRDRELQAEVIGVDLARVRVAAWVASGALAAVAGALYGSYKHYVAPDEWTLLLSVQYLAIVLLGGMGTVAGPVLGALFLGLVPRLVEQVGGALPLVAEGTGSGLTVAELNQIVFGALIVLFVVVEPKGLTALAGRARRRARAARVTNRASTAV